MSVLVTLRVPVDPANLEQAAKDNTEEFLGIAGDAKSRGAIHHDFYAGDGEVFVVDEWESPEAFQSFFEANGEKIGRLMAAAQAGQPDAPSFYRKMSLGDEF